MYDILELNEKLLSDLRQIAKELNVKTLWDNFTDNKPGISSAVEVNGENVYTIIENLKTEGIYLADTIEEN